MRTFLVLVALVACKKTPTEEFQHWIDNTRAVRDAVCACKDKACIKQAVGHDGFTSKDEMDTADVKKMPDDKVKELNKVVDELGVCRANYPGHAAAVLAKWLEIADQSCACKDKPCAENMINVMVTFVGEEEVENVKYANESDHAKASAADDKATACLQALNK